MNRVTPLRPQTPEETVISFLKRHSRWNPLASGEEMYTQTIKLDDISFDVVISQAGFVVFVKFNRRNENDKGVILTTADGLYRIEDADTEIPNVVNQFAPLMLETRTYPPLILPKMYQPKRIGVLQIPHNFDNICFYDFNWLWNRNIPDVFASTPEGNQVDGGRFLTVWLTFGQDNESRYPVSNLSFANNKISFNVNVPEGFTNIDLCNFHLRAGTRQVQTFLQLNVRNMQWVLQNGVRQITNAQYALNLENNIFSVEYKQSRDVNTYILEAFQFYVYPGETRIISVGRNYIAPLQFCTRVAAFLDTIVQIVLKDEEKRVRFSVINGFEISNVSWGTRAMLRMPIISLQKSILFNVIKSLRALERIEITRRTPEQFEEMRRLIDIIRYGQDHTNIDCSICGQPAKVQSVGNYVPYCSRSCALVELPSRSK